MYGSGGSKPSFQEPNMRLMMPSICAFLLALLAVGCNRSNDAAVTQAKTEAETARTELGKEKARADAAEAELAKLKAAAAPSTVILDEREKAMAVVKQLGGKLEADSNVPGHPVVILDLRKTKLTDEGLANLRGLRDLKVLYLGGSQITDAGLAQVANFAKLEELTVNEGGGQITDAGLKHLVGLKSLKKVVFGAFSTVGGPGLEGLTGLEGLDIAYSSADDNTLASIGKLTSLRHLRLDHNNKITDAGLAELAGLGELRFLGLYNVANVTDASLKHLHGLKHLERLSLQGTKTTEEGIRLFKVAVPACAVER
jgi:Leucine-rich repeat (LRR) protein